MNVFHVLDERWDSAVTAYGLSLAGALKARGHSVFVGSRPGTYAFREAERSGLPLFSLGSVLSFRRFLRQNGFQVVNSHTGTGHFLGWLGTAGRAIALVRTRGDARSVEKSWGRRLLYNRTDAVVGASRCIAVQYASAFPFLEDRVATVYPGLEVPPFQPEPEGPVRIALVARLDPVKGHDDFLAAVEHLRPELKDEEFVISGEEKNRTEAELRGLADRRGVSRWLRFQGRQGDVAAFMRSCHAGVITSVGSEALSRVCLEWMALGRPVAATAVGCLPELVSSGENGFLVPPRNPRALAQCLLTFIRRESLRRRMGENARDMIVRRFSLTRMATETEKIYEEAMRRRLSRRS